MIGAGLQNFGQSFSTFAGASGGDKTSGTSGSNVASAAGSRMGSSGSSALSYEVPTTLMQNKGFGGMGGTKGFGGF